MRQTKASNILFITPDRQDSIHCADAWKGDVNTAAVGKRRLKRTYRSGVVVGCGITKQNGEMTANDRTKEQVEMVYQMNGVCDQLWKTTAIQQMPSSPIKDDLSWQRNLAVAGRMLLIAITFLLFVLLAPVIGVVTLMFWLYRAILIITIKIRASDLVTMVDGDDSMWLQDDETNRAIINIMLIHRGRPKIDDLRDIFYNRLVDTRDEKGVKLYPKLTQYATKVIRRYVWMEETKFNINDHVFIHKTPLPTDKTEREALIGEIVSTGLPEEKSAWQAVILVGENEPASGVSDFFILFRIHHSVGDGISLIRTLMYSLVDKSPPRVRSNRFCAKGVAIRIIKALVQGPLVLAERFAWRGDHSTLHGQQLSGTKLLAWSEPIDLGLIKKIKNVTGATVNDVLISCLSSAFGDYFRQLKVDVSTTNLNAYIPVDIRPASHSGSRMTNQFALVFLQMPINSDNVLDTLHMTKARMDTIKSSPEPLVSGFAITYGMNHLPNWTTKCVFDWLSSKCTMVLSNVPGPTQSLSIGGHLLEGITFWPPQRSNIGLGVSIFSYGGFVRVGILSDKVLMEKPRFIIEKFLKKVDELVTLLKLE
ncbi:hypothetical protein LSAT2_013586 [Lamellibrachia satsuma]|nr:hypothetical protein LSAT2_013586 [Lamellibrachia satsuma]